MTEKSYFWDGTSVGDATLAPYTSEVWRGVFDFLFQPSSDYRLNYVANSHFGSTLKVEEVSYLRIKVNPGSALIAGSPWWMDEPEYFNLAQPASGYYYYSIVLQGSVAGQEINMQLLGPSTTDYPSPVSSDYVIYHDVARISVDNTGDLDILQASIKAMYNGTQAMVVVARIGFLVSQYEWGTFGSDDIIQNTDVAMQIGSKRWSGSSATSGNVTVTFPLAFPYKPLVLAQCRLVGGFDSTYHMRCSVSGVSTTQCTLYWKTNTALTELDIGWMALGEAEAH